MDYDGGQMKYESSRGCSCWHGGHGQLFRGVLFPLVLSSEHCCAAIYQGLASWCDDKYGRTSQSLSQVYINRLKVGRQKARESAELERRAAASRRR